jgi:hypothetical protein
MLNCPFSDFNLKAEVYAARRLSAAQTPVFERDVIYDDQQVDRRYPSSVEARGQFAIQLTFGFD